VKTGVTKVKNVCLPHQGIDKTLNEANPNTIPQL
jgi:hypothetical protein